MPTVDFHHGPPGGFADFRSAAAGHSWLLQFVEVMVLTGGQWILTDFCN